MMNAPTATATRPYHHGNLREAILNAALDVLRREEPAALSLRELARTVGVRHSALYVHFRDKNALLAVIAGQGFQALRHAMQATLKDGGGLAELASTYILFARNNPAHYRTMFLPEVSSPENHAHIQDACEACFGTLIEQLATSASPKDEMHERAIGIWSTLHGLALLGGDSGPLHSQVGPQREPLLAGKIVQVLAQAAWPTDQSSTCPETPS